MEKQFLDKMLQFKNNLEVVRKLNWGGETFLRKFQIYLLKILMAVQVL